MRQMGEVAHKERQARVPKLIRPIVETHQLESAAKKVVSTKQKRVGKDRKRLRFLANGGTPRSRSNASGIEKFEGPDIQMRQGVDIKLSDHEFAIVEEVESGTALKALVEFQAHSFEMG